SLRPSIAVSVSLASLLGALSAVLALSACTGDSAGAGASAAAPKYPRRRPGCKLAVYAGPKPGVAAGDGLGPAEGGSQLDTSRPKCLAQLRAEACRLGADILYDMPAKPLRPKEQAMIFRARAAHTRLQPEKAEKHEKPKPGEEPPPPATEEESAGPVIPLG